MASKNKAVTVAFGALGVMKKGTNAFNENIPESPLVEEVQKLVLSSTAYVL